jgi:hypothetical protein
MLLPGRDLGKWVGVADFGEGWNRNSKGIQGAILHAHVSGRVYWPKWRFDQAQFANMISRITSATPTDQVFRSPIIPPLRHEASRRLCGLVGKGS